MNEQQSKQKEKTPAVETRPDLDHLNAVERFYERFRDVPLRRIDTFIGICVVALILVVIVGMLDGNGVF